MSEEANVDIEDMSDDEFLAMELPDEVAPEVDDKEETDDDATTEEEADSEDDKDEELDSDDESELESKTPSDDDSEEETNDEELSDDETGDDEEEAEEGESSEVADNYAAIMAPFKANGKDITVDSPDDVRQLMKMGANYHKKMASLKPNLKLMKMLQNNDLLDEGKLSYLIDLNKNDPNAIKKLIKDSKLNIDDLETGEDEEVDYTPNAYAVNDAEVDVESVLEEIQSTDSYSKTVDIVANKLDEKSKEAISKEPAIIRIINDQVASGVYDKIMSAVDKERMLGKLTDMSDIQAYQFIGNQLNEKGQLAPQKQAPKSNKVVKPSKSVTEKDKTKLTNRKKAASTTRTKQAKREPLTGINPLEMSDEEFEKKFSGTYL